jgi:NADPH2:quinone reductase
MRARGHEREIREVRKVGAIRFDAFGGPDVLQYREVEVPEPRAGEALIEHTAIGVNFGVVRAVGSGADHLRIGGRVAYAAPAPPGSYSEARVVDARWLVPLPDGIDAATGAAMMLKGLTSWFLLRRSYRVQPDDWIVVYAAAGGVGSIAAQWARHLGARVIGIVGSEQKRRLALERGCEHVLLSSEAIVERVRELTGGVGVPVVYDSVGRDTLIQSLDCLRPHGVLVSFGNSSGKVAPFELLELTKRGSLYVTRPTLFDFIRQRSDLEAGCAELFELVRAHIVEIPIGQRYPLRDAARAHGDLEARRTTGATILEP